MFHEDSTGVYHNGFDREMLKAAFRDAGFVEVRDRTAATMTKPAADGKIRSFTIGLVTGKKPENR
jgi:hypothetical protein